MRQRLIEFRFLSTLSLRRATPRGDSCYLDNIISIHALLAESDAVQIVIIVVDALFLSTLSLRRATIRKAGKCNHNKDFYPRSPCGERLRALPSFAVGRYFYPRSPCGERPTDKLYYFACPFLFLSTLSLRRATEITDILKRVIRYFYPRSPCGERRLFS